VRWKDGSATGKEHDGRAPPRNYFGFGMRLTTDGAPKQRRGCSNGAKSGFVNGGEVREGGCLNEEWLCGEGLCGGAATVVVRRSGVDDSGGVEWSYCNGNENAKTRKKKREDEKEK